MIVYVAIWLLVFLLPLFNELIRVSNGQDFSWCNVIRWWIGLIPFLVVFAVNNILLVPLLLKKKKVKMYFILLLTLLVLFVSFQHSTHEIRKEIFYNKVELRIGETSTGSGSGAVTPVHPPKPKYRFLGMPMSVFLNVALYLMLIGVNTAVIFVFKYTREREMRKLLENMRLQDELKFLKAQINPHFFMNMMNNIHSMIEIDPEKAQDITIGLSKLMRYILYEGDSSAVLADEVAFINDYVGLMRCRYPEGKVEISMDLPPNPSREIRVPALVFIAFVENAFKHGISFRTRSYVHVKIEEDGGEVHFTCGNSRYANDSKQNAKGVGLDNVRRRLDLIYGDDYSLDIKEENNSFNINLIIPSL